MKTTTNQATETEITISVRAFGGRLEQVRCLVTSNGTVRVYDPIAGYYTTCHSLSARDQLRARCAASSRLCAAARRSV